VASAGGLAALGINIKHKTLTALETLRQRGDDAGQLDIAPFRRVGKLIGETLLCHPAGPDKTEQRAENGQQQATWLVTLGKEKAGKRQHGQRTQDCKAGQLALDLQERDAARKSENG
jgi:hypothetical protein